MSYDSWETLKFQHESLNDGITYQLDRNMLVTPSVGSIKKNKSSAKVQEKQGYEKSITSLFPRHFLGMILDVVAG